MEFFRIHKDIPFMRHALVFNVISFATFALALFFLFSKGLHLSVEFTGGTLIETNYPQAANLEQIRGTVSKLGYTDVQVQNFGSSRDVLIRLPARKGENGQKQTEQLFAALCSNEAGQVQTLAAEGRTSIACLKDGAHVLDLKRNEFVGPSVGQELYSNGIKALLFVIAGIIIYLAFRFEWKFAVAAIIANLHDVIIILGFFAFFQWEFSLAVLAGVLAVLGYSVNESVIIFDRIREAFRRFRKLNTQEVINHAITANISRTIITHGSTQIMVLAMLFFGGPSLHYFAMALTIGILFGIYSSVFVAAAIVMWLGAEREDLVKISPAKEGEGTEAFDGAVV
jgi:preprotein translocase subunit SecF